MLTSGQLAQRCHTSIRTVQYYDQKGLLHAKRSHSNRREYDKCILQVKSAEKCNDFLHSLAAHFLFYLVI